MIDHIGIAVKDADRAKSLYGYLGFTVEKEEIVESQGVRVVFIAMGNTHVELLEPLNDESAIAKFIEKRGEGLHHLCIMRDNMEEVGETLKDRGVRLLYDDFAPGAGGSRINFIHPSSANGVLIEIACGGERHDT